MTWAVLWECGRVIDLTCKRVREEKVRREAERYGQVLRALVGYEVCRMERAGQEDGGGL